MHKLVYDDLPEAPIALIYSDYCDGDLEGIDVNVLDEYSFRLFRNSVIDIVKSQISTQILLV